MRWSFQMGVPLFKAMGPARHPIWSGGGCAPFLGMHPWEVRRILGPDAVSNPLYPALREYHRLPTRFPPRQTFEEWVMFTVPNGWLEGLMLVNDEDESQRWRLAH